VISLQWYVLVLTLRLAVYRLLGKQDQIWAKIFASPKICTPVHLWQIVSCWKQI